MRVTGLMWCLLFLVSCGDEEAVTDDPVLARVHQHALHLSELEGMFPRSATAEDSTLIIEAFVNRWVKDAVVQWESERNLPVDMNIDRLVRDYRSSLVKSTYEEVLVGMRLDSSISDQELEAYYDSNKEQYQLEKPIIRCAFIRVPYPTPEEEELRALWDNGRINDTTALANYTERFAEIALLDATAWFSLDEVAALLPEGTLTADNVGSKREFSQQDGSHRYYFKLIEMKRRLEIAPLEYIRDQARRVILHGRRMKVLEEAREEIFDRELRRKNIEIMTG